MNRNNHHHTQEAKYYGVTAKCGHVGLNYYIPIEFAVRADDGKTAAAIVKGKKTFSGFGRVKKNHTDAILGVREISEWEYRQIKKSLYSDPYMKASRKREMKAMMPLIEERLIVDPHANERDKHYPNESTARKEIYDHKRRIRHPKKYLRFINM